MEGDSSLPLLSQRVPGATKRPPPEMLIAPPMLPRSLLERLRAELRAELSEAQAREEPGRQLAPQRPGQPASVPLPVPQTDGGRPGRAKRRLLRDSKPGRPADSDVRPSIPVITAIAKAEAPGPAAMTVNGLAALAAADLAEQTTARQLPQRAKRPDAQRAPATADVPRMPTPPEMAKAAAALLAPFPEDITQPIPVIGADAQDPVVSLSTKAVNGRSGRTATDPGRHAAARPLPKRAQSPDQMPPAADVPMVPTQPEIPAPPGRLPARHPEDITQPIPVVRADALTEVVSPPAKTVNAQPDLAAAEPAPRDGLAETSADRQRRNTSRAAEQPRQRPERRRDSMPAAPPLDADQVLRPL